MPNRLRLWRALPLLIVFVGSFAVCAGDEPAPKAASAVLLKVGGEVPRPLSLTADDLAQLPRQTVKAMDRDGKEVEFEGVPVVEILQRTGLRMGQELRGTSLALYLLVEASDGYQVVFALPEVDPASTDRTILLADRRDGKPLAVNEGPIRIVVPGEKRHARWVRQVVSFKIRRA